MYTNRQPMDACLQEEFMKAFPPFLIYLATAIILFSFLKDMVKIGFHLSWLCLRLSYLPFILLIWHLSKPLFSGTKMYDTPLWIAILYITFLYAYFSLATGGLASDYHDGLLQVYFVMAIMPIRRITFYLLLISSVVLYVGINVFKYGWINASDYWIFFRFISWIGILMIIFTIISKIRLSRIYLQQSKTHTDDEEKITLGLMAAQMAHDIRSPLAALNVVAEELYRVPETVRVLMQRSIVRINDIANNLLNLYQKNKLYHVEDKLTPELISVLIDNVVSEKKMQFQKSDINFIYEISSYAHAAFANVMPIDFKRAISNLIDNAVEAITENGRVVIKVSATNDMITIILSDNGCGIPREYIKNLFAEGVTTKHHGSGLGLYQVKNAIERMNGSILIESKNNNGTVVTIILPRVISPNWMSY